MAFSPQCNHIWWTQNILVNIKDLHSSRGIAIRNLVTFTLTNFMRLRSHKSYWRAAGRGFKLNIEQTGRAVRLKQLTVCLALLHVIVASGLKNIRQHRLPWNWWQVRGTASSRQCCRGLNFKHERARRQEWERVGWSESRKRNGE